MLELTVLNSQQHFQKRLSKKQVSFGSSDLGSNSHVVIEDEYFAPVQCMIELFESDSDKSKRIRLVNNGKSLVLSSGSRLHNGIVEELTLPVVIRAGQTHIQIAFVEESLNIDTTLAEMPMAGLGSSDSLSGEGKLSKSPSPETLTSWFDAIGQIQRTAVGSTEFFELATHTVFNPGGMDGSIVFQKTEKGWESIARCIPYPDSGVDFRLDLIEQAARSRKVLYHDSTRKEEGLQPEHDHAAIICPIKDQDGNASVVLYGFRRHNRNNERVCIRSLEVQFVRMIADAISAGLTRMESEADIARKQVLLQQAYSPEVVAELENNPDVLKGEDREVSVLFADLRGFSKISEDIGARLTYQLLTDVMNQFCAVIADHDGIVIDFFGDGISAFWNAPVDQPKHALLACQAGRAIVESMRELNSTWAAEIGHRLRVGVGVHTGTAQVGNSGSRHRLKYGPQGITVNVAARLEAATKKVRADLLVSGETASRLKDEFLQQRICTAQLPGTNTETDLVCLVDADRYAKNKDYYEDYKTALEKFEAGEFTESTLILTELKTKYEYDRSIDFLLNESLAQSGTPAIDSDGAYSSKSDFEVVTKAADKNSEVADQASERSSSNVNSPDACPSEN